MPVALVPELVALAPQSAFRVAVRLQIPEGWHIYWKRPGQSGLPTTLAWQLPPQVSADSLSWPAPERLDSAGIVTHVYRGDVILVAHLHVRSDAAPGTVDLAADLRWGICREICIPQERRVVLSLPVGSRPENSPRWPDVERAAVAHLPARPARLELAALARRNGVILTVRSRTGPPVSAGRAVYFPDDSGLAVAVVLRGRSGPRGVAFTLPVMSAARLKGVLVSDEGWGAPGDPRALAVDLPLDRRE